MIYSVCIKCCIHLPNLSFSSLQIYSYLSLHLSLPFPFLCLPFLLPPSISLCLSLSLSLSVSLSLSLPDYRSSSLPTSVMFGFNQLQMCFNVTILEDEMRETTEYFSINISNPTLSDVHIAVNTTMISILDNDGNL